MNRELDTLASSHPVAAEAVKAAGAWGGLIAVINDWGGALLTILVVVYTAAQLYFLLRDKWWRDKNGRNR